MAKAEMGTAGGGAPRYGRWRGIMALALALGLAGAAISWLSTSLMIPGPGHMASTQELRERGGEINVEFCKPIASEPRFWPECVGGGAAAWRQNGGDALVAYCASPVPDRMLSASDCLSDDRASVVLTHAPDPRDAAVGGIVAVAAFVLLGARALASRALRSGA